MTKQQIKTKIEGNWIDALEDKSREQALVYLATLPDGAMLETDYYGYDGGKYGEIFLYRMETDEEESTREAAETLAEEDRIRKLTAKQLLEKMALEEKLEKLKWEDVALHAYLSLHKDNPKVGDLENLMRSLMGLERVGASFKSMEALRECMKRIENYDN